MTPPATTAAAVGTGASTDLVKALGEAHRILGMVRAMRPSHEGGPMTSRQSDAMDLPASNAAPAPRPERKRGPRD